MKKVEIFLVGNGVTRKVAVELLFQLPVEYIGSRRTAIRCKALGGLSSHLIQCLEASKAIGKKISLKVIDNEDDCLIVEITLQAEERKELVSKEPYSGEEVAATPVVVYIEIEIQKRRKNKNKSRKNPVLKKRLLLRQLPLT